MVGDSSPPLPPRPSGWSERERRKLVVKHTRTISESVSIRRDQPKSSMQALRSFPEIWS
jgi:hypothetical protein